MSSMYVIAFAFLTFSSFVQGSSTVNITGPGNAVCRCITAEEGAGDNLADPDQVLTLAYGIGCGKHDAGQSYPLQCDADNALEYCEAKWCYVSSDCALSHTKSKFRPGRFYSYATCGYIDKYSPYVVGGTLSELTLNVVYLTNSGGWRGGYCTADGSCEGPVGELLQWVLKEANVVENQVARIPLTPTFEEYKHIFPPEVINQVLLDNPNGTSSHDTCVYAAGMGYIDLCIGAFGLRPSRVQVAQMLVIYSMPAYLISLSRREDKDFFDYIFHAFAPFKLQTWVAIAAFIFLMSFLMMCTERISGGFYDEHSIPESLAHATYIGTKSFADGGTGFEPRRPGGRWTNLGLGFFLLLTLSAYTAHLATSLILKPRTVPMVESWDAVVAGSALKVCASGSAALFARQFLKVPADQLVQLSSRTEVTQIIGTSICAVGILAGEDFEAVRAEGENCYLMKVGDPLFSYEYAVPVSARASRALQYHLTRAKQSHIGVRSFGNYQPGDNCAEQAKRDEEDAEYDGLEVKDMAGPMALSTLFCLVGLAYELGQYFWNRARGSKQQNDPAVFRQSGRVRRSSLCEADDPRPSFTPMSSNASDSGSPLQANALEPSAKRTSDASATSQAHEFADVVREFERFQQVFVGHMNSSQSATCAPLILSQTSAEPSFPRKGAEPPEVSPRGVPTESTMRSEAEETPRDLPPAVQAILGGSYPWSSYHRNFQ